MVVECHWLWQSCNWNFPLNFMQELPKQWQQQQQPQISCSCKNTYIDYQVRMGLFVIGTLLPKSAQAKECCAENCKRICHCIRIVFIRSRLLHIKSLYIGLLQNEKVFFFPFKCGLVNKFKMNTYKVTLTMFILLGNIYNNNNLTESLVCIYILDAHSCMNEA